MKVKDIVAALDAKLICGEQNVDKPVASACGADLMSDVLSFAKSDSVLLTGMVNTHVIRTAEMLDVVCIVFVRGKQPLDEVCTLAEQTGIVILTCEQTLYEACGLLYGQGLPPCSKV